MASTSLQLGSGPLDQIDSGRFAEAKAGINQLSNPKAIDIIAKAEVELYSGDLAEAEAALLTVGLVANDIEIAARLALAEGELLFARRDYYAAQKKFNAAYYLSEFMKDKFGSALALYRNSRIVSQSSQQDETIKMLHEAYESLRGQGPKGEFLRGLIDFQLAVCERRRGRDDESEQLYHSAIDTLKESERGRYYALVLVSYGTVERERGNLVKALELFEEAMNLLNRLNLFADLAHALCELSLVLISQRSHERAERLLLECLDLYRRTENTNGEARAMILLARMEFDRNRPRKAREYALRASELSDLTGDPFLSASARVQLARSSST
ncbi:MAG TPA: tetratricopeptide repeat protein, partial [Blastocatellia bacterium]|nr:tetratricopeptide repeat protein [Blastocatellia bacterium]